MMLVWILRQKKIINRNKGSLWESLYNVRDMENKKRREQNINKVAIIGGGASGVCLGILLKRKGIDVHIFEKDTETLKKVKATGNGRCNFTNLNISPKYYLGDQEFTSLMTKERYKESIDFFYSLGVLSKNLESGRVYPYTMQSKTIVDSLNKEAMDLGIVFHKDIEIRKVKKDKGLYILYGDKNYTFEYVVLATGGLKGISKNSFSNGYEIAKGFGHNITSLRSGITSLDIKDRSKVKGLSGVKQYSKIYLVVDGKIVDSEIGDVLFRDYGLSGLAILQISNKVVFNLLENKNIKIKIDLLPEFTFDYIKELVKVRIKESNKMMISDIFSSFVNEKIIKNVFNYLSIKDQVAKKVSIDKIDKIIKELKGFELTIEKERDDGQITIGGVEVKDISRELESKLSKNLYFCGEILNLQGESGGYNLQWAWTSSKIVSESIIRREYEKRIKRA